MWHLSPTATATTQLTATIIISFLDHCEILPADWPSPVLPLTFPPIFYSATKITSFRNTNMIRWLHLLKTNQPTTHPPTTCFHCIYDRLFKKSSEDYRTANKPNVPRLPLLPHQEPLFPHSLRCSSPAALSSSHTLPSSGSIEHGIPSGPNGPLSSLHFYSFFIS